MVDSELDQIFLYKLVRVKGDSGRGEHLAPLDINGVGTGDIIQGETLSPEESERIYNAPETLNATHIGSNRRVPGTGSLTHTEEYHVYSGVGVEEPTVDFTVDITTDRFTHRAPVWPLQTLRRAVAERISQRPINVIV